MSSGALLRLRLPLHRGHLLCGHLLHRLHLWHLWGRLLRTHPAHAHAPHAHHGRGALLRTLRIRRLLASLHKGKPAGLCGGRLRLRLRLRLGNGSAHLTSTLANSAAGKRVKVNVVDVGDVDHRLLAVALLTIIARAAHTGNNAQT